MFYRVNDTIAANRFTRSTTNVPEMPILSAVFTTKANLWYHRILIKKQKTHSHRRVNERSRKRTQKVLFIFFNFKGEDLQLKKKELSVTTVTKNRITPLSYNNGLD